MRGLEEKVAIVTGAASGIGRATAERFAAEGARVVCADIDEEGGCETVRRISGEGGEATFVRTDVSKASQVEAMVETAVDEYGRLDFAHNNAGIAEEEAAITDVDEDVWDEVMDVNMKSVYLGMKHEIPRMLETGGGAIVNTASKAGLKPYPFNAAYAGSKHGVVGITRAAAYEFARKGIRVNALCPGITATGGISKWSESAVEEVCKGIPMGRMGRPEEQAGAAVWLCSDDASYMTGHALPVDGGDLRKLHREYKPGRISEVFDLSDEELDLPDQ